VDPQYRQLPRGMALFGILAGLALLVAMTDMFSLVAYNAAQRSHEFGIRVALGARAGSLAGLMCWRRDSNPQGLAPGNVAAFRTAPG
jgi:hypothetical protein